MDKKDTLIINLCMCSLANNPTDAVKHQVSRLLEHYREADNKKVFERLFNLLYPQDTTENFTIVQSNTVNPS